MRRGMTRVEWLVVVSALAVLAVILHLVLLRADYDGNYYLSETLWAAATGWVTYPTTGSPGTGWQHWA